MNIVEKLSIVNDYVDQSSPPIEIVPLANRLGIRVYDADWPMRISGRIQKDAEKGGHSGFAIFVNKSHPTQRRRFTIAHELAHYILHENEIGDGIYDDALYRSGLSTRQESQANGLAADILTPWQYLNEYIEISGDDAAALAVTFNVSETAMRIRLNLPV